MLFFALHLTWKHPVSLSEILGQSTAAAKPVIQRNLTDCMICIQNIPIGIRGTDILKISLKIDFCILPNILDR